MLRSVSIWSNRARSVQHFDLGRAAVSDLVLPARALAGVLIRGTCVAYLELGLREAARAVAAQIAAATGGQRAPVQLADRQRVLIRLPGVGNAVLHGMSRRHAPQRARPQLAVGLDVHVLRAGRAWTHAERHRAVLLGLGELTADRHVLVRIDPDLARLGAAVF